MRILVALVVVSSHAHAQSPSDRDRCLRQRAQLLREAQTHTDLEKRTRLLRELPDCGLAPAEPAPPPDLADAPTESLSPKKARSKLHAEVTGFAGQVTYRSLIDDTRAIMGVRWSFGITFMTESLATRFGAVAEASSTGSNTASLGAELQVDRPLRLDSPTPDLRVGGRVQLARSDGGQAEGTFFTIGPRMRAGPVVAGLDFVGLLGQREYAYGWELSIGISDRPGKYALGASAVGGAVVAVLVYFALRSAGSR